jgi:hypothetical protein
MILKKAWSLPGAIRFPIPLNTTILKICLISPDFFAGMNQGIFHGAAKGEIENAIIFYSD